MDAKVAIVSQRQTIRGYSSPDEHWPIQEEDLDVKPTVKRSHSPTQASNIPNQLIRDTWQD
jgi:hypothetical protein